MAKVKGLGRGLDALLGEEDAPATAAVRDTQAPQDDKTGRLAELPVSQLTPGKYQPRTRMDETALRELADSIKAQGLMQPILVRPVAAGRYEIIAGERRWRAAQLAGLAAVPVQIRAVPDHAALAMALIENIQREDLNAVEEATGLQRLITEFGMTHEAAAQAVGRSRAAVSNLLRLLALSPAIREMVQRSEIDMGHARALLALNAAQQLELAREIVSKGWSVRDTEQQVALLLRGKPAAAARGARAADRDVLRLQEELSERLGTSVQIKNRGSGRGKLVISYSTLDQLDGILRRLKHE